MDKTTEMKPLDPPDTHHLQAAIGWLELENANESFLELDKISNANQQHPDVLELRWQTHAKKREWPHALDVSSLLVRQAPGRPSGWIHRSFALHEMDKTEEAHDLLLPALAIFKENWIIPFNVACYLCQMDKKQEALEKLKLAIERGGDEAMNTALKDPDLAPLLKEIRKLQP